MDCKKLNLDDLSMVSGGRREDMQTYAQVKSYLSCTIGSDCPTCHTAEGNYVKDLFFDGEYYVCNLA